jgi:hypothetical protein
VFSLRDGLSFFILFRKEFSSLGLDRVRLLCTEFRNVFITINIRNDLQTLFMCVKVIRRIVSQLCILDTGEELD